MLPVYNTSRPISLQLGSSARIRDSHTETTTRPRHGDTWHHLDIRVPNPKGSSGLAAWCKGAVMVGPKREESRTGWGACEATLGPYASPASYLHGHLRAANRLAHPRVGGGVEVAGRAPGC